MAGKVSKQEQIMEAALTLFSQKGYDGVGVDEIGEKVGMKGPTLYYYFKSKDALLDALIDKEEAYYQANFGSAGATHAYPGSLEELIECSMQRLMFTIHDPEIQKVRKMLAMEQFRNEKLRALTTKHQLTGLEELNAAFFAKLIELGKVKPFDSRMLAFEFTAPVTLLIQWIDREPEHEYEAMARIRQHMTHFAEMYGV